MQLQIKPLQSRVACEREQITRSGRFEKRIGSTAYRVSVYWDAHANETLEDKILRMLKNDLQSLEKRAIITPLQTVRLSNGGSL